jgi:vacuolar-type H+-ATPase subunit D/Vma8
LSHAIAAYGEALDAGVKHAAAQAAHRRILAELGRTRRRLRGLEARAIPAYEEALTLLELQLDENEREDLIRTKWAMASAQRSRDLRSP